MPNLPPLQVGQVLYGYCEGWFGRDSYEDKRIEAIGIDWVVCRGESGAIHFAAVYPSYEERFGFKTINEMLNKPENLKPQED